MNDPEKLLTYFTPGQLVWVDPSSPGVAAAWAGTLLRAAEPAGVWLVRTSDGSRGEQQVGFGQLRPRLRDQAAAVAAVAADRGSAAGAADSASVTVAQLGALRVDSSDSSDEEDDAESALMREKVDAVLREFSLSRALMAAARMWVKEMADPVKGKDLEHIRMWFVDLLAGRRRSPPQDRWQAGCPEIVPKLRAQPWWGRAELPWLADLEAGWGDVQEELMALRGGGHFQPYRAPSWAGGKAAADGIGKVSHDSGDWNVYYLELHGLGKLTEANAARCPKTVALLQKAVPRYYGHAFFSALAPSTHITKHNGPTNKKLRIHLPVFGTAGSLLRCAGSTRDVVGGQAMVFDDSFEHEAWHDGPETRITLIVDIWHPDLSDREVKFLSTLQRARMKAEQARAEKMPVATEDDFFGLLKATKDLRPDDNSWWTVKPDPQQTAAKPDAAKLDVARAEAKSEAAQPAPQPAPALPAVVAAAATAGLTCVACHVEQPKSAFSGSQQKKAADGQGKCQACAALAQACSGQVAAAPAVEAGGTQKKKKKEKKKR